MGKGKKKTFFSLTPIAVEIFDYDTSSHVIIRVFKMTTDVCITGGVVM